MWPAVLQPSQTLSCSRWSCTQWCGIGCQFSKPRSLALFLQGIGSWRGRGDKCGSADGACHSCCLCPRLLAHPTGCLPPGELFEDTPVVLLPGPIGMSLLPPGAFKDASPGDGRLIPLPSSPAVGTHDRTSVLQPASPALQMNVEWLESPSHLWGLGRKRTLWGKWFSKC